MQRHAKEAEAKRLRGDGLTFAQIAARLEVGERTVQRWATSWETPSAPAADWPESRSWPERWDAASLLGPWLDEKEAHAFMRLVEGAKRQGHRWSVWFLRRLIEVDREESQRSENERIGLDHATAAWRDLIAAAPVLAAWIGCPELERLPGLIRETKPYRIGFIATPEQMGWRKTLAATFRGDPRGSKAHGLARKAYAASARPIVAAFRERVDAFNYLGFVGSAGIENVGDPWDALEELCDRLPTPDTAMKSVRGPMLGALFLRIFSHEPPKEADR